MGVPLTEIYSIPELDHLCRVTSCCAPKHLEPVTHGENIRRGDLLRRKTEADACSNGHRWTPESTYVRPDNGCRQCRECHRASGRKAYDPAKRAARYQAKKLRA